MWDDGSLQQIISSQARELLDAYSSGEKILVGVNKFVNPDEAIAKAPPVPLQNGGIAPLQLAHALLQKSE
jgi:methylmalonyl-CoA mutase N-terminal domain/subunit